MIDDDPAIAKLHARLTQLVELCVRDNHPLTATGAGGKSPNKPESKPPGYQQCPAAVRAAERILTRAVKDLQAAYDAAKVRERRWVESEWTAAERDAARRVRQERREAQKEGSPSS